LSNGPQQLIDILTRVIKTVLRELDLILSSFRNSRRGKRTKKKPLVSSRATLLFLLPLPLLAALTVSLAKGDFLKVIVDGAGLALFLYAGVLARRGLANEARYHARRIAAAPIPLKTAAALLIALTCTLVAHLSAGYHLAVATLFGIGALLGFYLVYGLDPRKPKRPKTHPDVNSEQLVAALEEGYQAITTLEAAGERIPNAEFKARLERITALAQRILAHIESDPRQLRRARKFLNVYLDGVRQVAAGYARSHGKDESGELEENFRHALVSIEQVFGEQYQKLQESNLMDLDVQIEVLRNQLEREGVL